MISSKESHTDILSGLLRANGEPMRTLCADLKAEKNAQVAKGMWLKVKLQIWNTDSWNRW
jgi:hypothetical protein